MNTPQPAAYFQRHIFFCTNERADGRTCCAQHDAQQALSLCKQIVYDAGCSGAGAVRVNQAGCLGRCSSGPVAVVYPQGVWYSYASAADVREIAQEHLLGGRVVQRLLLP